MIIDREQMLRAISYGIVRRGMDRLPYREALIQGVACRALKQASEILDYEDMELTQTRGQTSE